MQHSFSRADVDIVSFLYAYSQVDMYGDMMIDAHIHDVVAALRERAIVLESDIAVRAIPTLRVCSPRVQAVHGASVSSFDPSYLVYLKSR